MTDANHKRVAGPGTIDEYAAVLLARAAKAAERGDYGVSALLSARFDGSEMVIFGENTVFTLGDPLGHAEITALRRLTDLLARASSTPHPTEKWTRARARDTNVAILSRPLLYQSDELVMMSLLEPCPMCTVALINAGVNRVVFLQEDSLAGASAPSRIARLGRFWAGAVKQKPIGIEFGAGGLPPTLLNGLHEVFQGSREALDRKLRAQGAIDREILAAVVAGSRRP
jgi:tRNA(Arg) A34 adenosine deaminase TadA